MYYRYIVTDVSKQSIVSLLQRGVLKVRLRLLLSVVLNGAILNTKQSTASIGVTTPRDPN